MDDREVNSHDAKHLIQNLFSVPTKSKTKKPSKKLKHTSLPSYYNNNLKEVQRMGRQEMINDATKTLLQRFLLFDQSGQQDGDKVNFNEKPQLGPVFEGHPREEDEDDSSFETIEEEEFIEGTDEEVSDYDTLEKKLRALQQTSGSSKMSLEASDLVEKYLISCQKDESKERKARTVTTIRKTPEILKKTLSKVQKTSENAIRSVSVSFTNKNPTLNMNETESLKIKEIEEPQNCFDVENRFKITLREDQKKVTAEDRAKMEDFLMFGQVGSRKQMESVVGTPMDIEDSAETSQNSKDLTEEILELPRNFNQKIKKSSNTSHLVKQKDSKLNKTYSEQDKKNIEEAQALMKVFLNFGKAGKTLGDQLSKEKHQKKSPPLEQKPKIDLAQTPEDSAQTSQQESLGSKPNKEYTEQDKKNIAQAQELMKVFLKFGQKGNTLGDQLSKEKHQKKTPPLEQKPKIDLAQTPEDSAQSSQQESVGSKPNKQYTEQDKKNIAQAQELMKVFLKFGQKGNTLGAQLVKAKQTQQIKFAPKKIVESTDGSKVTSDDKTSKKSYTDQDKKNIEEAQALMKVFLNFGKNGDTLGNQLVKSKNPPKVVQNAPKIAQQPQREYTEEEKKNIEEAKALMNVFMNFGQKGKTIGDQLKGAKAATMEPKESCSAPLSSSQSKKEYSEEDKKNIAEAQALMKTFLGLGSHSDTNTKSELNGRSMLQKIRTAKLLKKIKSKKLERFPQKNSDK